jgi:hypothetical protein
MDFDWSLYPLDENYLSTEEVAESFEDGFCLRFIPSGKRYSTEIRFFCLGSSLKGRRIFSVYTSGENIFKVIYSRLMTPEEELWYQTRVNKLIST